jgi:DNA-binding transcriptional regulator YhcF (GntR family)
VENAWELVDSAIVPACCGQRLAAAPSIAMPNTPETIAEILRDRIVRGIRAGTLEPGARLPSARELVSEFNVDNRIILAAYKQLAADGLVTIRERGGVYVQHAPGGASQPSVPVKWFADVFAEAVARGIASDDLAECMRRLVETVRLRAIVISTTEDQVAGLARELREDFGLNAEGFPAAVLTGSGLHQAALKRADVFIATSGHAALAESLGTEFAKPVLTIQVRPDLIIGEWAMLLRQPIWAVVATAEFGDMLRRFFASVPGIENLRVLVHGRDDLSEIPLGAPTYVTHRVREALDVTPIRGKILPPARTISTDSAREIFDFIVRANYRAQHAIQLSHDAASRRA